MIRFFDITISSLGLLIMSPIITIIVLLIRFESKGNVIFRQERIGLNGKPFTIYKFRTMKPDADNKILLTLEMDPRVTRTGKFLRKTKLDEIPQLVNVLKGEMSIVGPRPEVGKYVVRYTDKQKEILSTKPGITDIASIYFFNEGKLLRDQDDPEQYYEQVIIPRKIELNMEYIENKSLKLYFAIILKTFTRYLWAGVSK